MLGLPLGPPRKVRLVGGLSAGLFPLEFLAAAAKPFKTRAAISNRRRQLIATRLPKLLVLGSVRLGGLFEHRVDLLRIDAYVRVAPGDALPEIRLPSNATRPTDTNPARAHSANTCVKVAASACSWRARKRAIVA